MIIIRNAPEKVIVEQYGILSDFEVQQDGGDVIYIATILVNGESLQIYSN